MIKVFFTRQFLRFLVSGGAAALLHWLSRMVFSEWFSFAVAVLLAYGVGMACAFALNFFFVFPRSTQPIRQQIRGFVLVNLLFMPIVWLASMHIRRALNRIGDGSHIDAIAHGLAIMLPTFVTFLIYKYITFRESHHGQQ